MKRKKWYNIWNTIVDERKEILMTEKELHSLKRSDLLRILIEQEKELESTKRELEQLEQRWQTREIQLEEAGNIAEAALLVNGVFEKAQIAAQQYVESVKSLSERQEKIFCEKEKQVRERCESKQAETKKECMELLEETKKKCAQLEEETKKKCIDMEKVTETKIENRWSDLKIRLESFYEAHKGLRELIEVTSEIKSE